ncbi:MULTISPECIES: hypothetical protein [Rhizobium]|uniref:hypothetical protein n=1 Tax=Rhizobium TaxID=379 RepID=UPI001C831E31|nr:hypothetical protein [Rhizobium bangladeshense]MBX5014537.1 hypothetical protein [Rhizobium lentis]
MADLCRKHQMSEGMFYKRKAKYGVCLSLLRGDGEPYSANRVHRIHREKGLSVGKREARGVLSARVRRSWSNGITPRDLAYSKLPRLKLLLDVAGHRINDSEEAKQ